MRIFAIICTREANLKPVTKGLVHTLSSYGVNVKLLIDQKSIFSAYQKGLDICKPEPTDIIIYCHDDIQIFSPRQSFIAALAKCVEADTGIVGPAGTSFLGEDAVWWNMEKWKKGYHKGAVKHLSRQDPAQVVTTSYGETGQVVALDGLFLAARAEVWEKINLKKPNYFKGKWDFYDIHYTTTAHNLGYKNYVLPIDMLHHSNGELVGRDSWHQNRQAFIANTNLPIRI